MVFFVALHKNGLEMRPRQPNQQEQATLQNFGLIQHYDDNRLDYDHLAKSLYRSKSIPPSGEKLILELSPELLAFQPFVDFLSNKNLINIANLAFYANNLSRYIVHETWDDIIAP